MMVLGGKKDTEGERKREKDKQERRRRSRGEERTGEESWKGKEE